MFELLPAINKLIDTGFSQQSSEQDLLKGLHVLTALVPHMPRQLDSSLHQWAEHVTACLGHQSADVRRSAATCAAAIVQNGLHTFMSLVLR